MEKTTFGVIVRNRGFFPDILAKQGRKDILEVLKNSGYTSVALSIQDTIRLGLRRDEYLCANHNGPEKTPW